MAGVREAEFLEQDHRPVVFVDLQRLDLSGSREEEEEEGKKEQERSGSRHIFAIHRRRWGWLSWWWRGKDRGPTVIKERESYVAEWGRKIENPATAWPYP